MHVIDAYRLRWCVRQYALLQSKYGTPIFKSHKNGAISKLCIEWKKIVTGLWSDFEMAMPTIMWIYIYSAIFRPKKYYCNDIWHKNNSNIENQNTKLNIRDKRFCNHFFCFVVQIFNWNLWESELVIEVITIYCSTKFIVSTQKTTREYYLLYSTVRSVLLRLNVMVCKYAAVLHARVIGKQQ